MNSEDSKFVILIEDERINSIYPYTYAEVVERIKKYKKYNASIEYKVYKLTEINIA